MPLEEAIMAETILSSIKPMCNVFPMDPSFDTVLIPYANTAFMYLRQMGVGPKEPFRINETTEWSAFFGSGDAEEKDIEAARTYIGYKTRLLFDPPTNQTQINAINEAIKEAEWRLITQEEFIRERA